MKYHVHGTLADVMPFDLLSDNTLQVVMWLTSSMP